MKSSEIDINGKKVMGIEIPLPGAPLVIAYGEKGFVMCGYLDIQTANKLDVAAAVVRGVSTVDDLLEAKIQAVSVAAEKKGVKIGMTGQTALSWLV